MYLRALMCVYSKSRRNEFHDPNKRFLNPFCEHRMKKKSSILLGVRVIGMHNYLLINILNKILERGLRRRRRRTRCLSTIAFDFVAGFVPVIIVIEFLSDQIIGDWASRRARRWPRDRLLLHRYSYNIILLLYILVQLCNIGGGGDVDLHTHFQ